MDTVLYLYWDGSSVCDELGQRMVSRLIIRLCISASRRIIHTPELSRQSVDNIVKTDDLSLCINTGTIHEDCTSLQEARRCFQQTIKMAYKSNDVSYKLKKSKATELKKPCACSSGLEKNNIRRATQDTCLEEVFEQSSLRLLITVEIVVETYTWKPSHGQGNSQFLRNPWSSWLHSSDVLGRKANLSYKYFTMKLQTFRKMPWAVGAAMPNRSAHCQERAAIIQTDG